MREAVFLLVDDMRTIRTLVARALENSMGVKTILMAANGREALAILRQRPVDLILSGWNMPVMSGEQLVQELRRDPELGKIPFIMMTSNGSHEFLMAAVRLGVTNYLVKPFTPLQLEEKVRLAYGYFNKRLSKRVAAIPPHIAWLAIDGQQFTGQFVDLSLNGALIRLKYDPSFHLFKKCSVSMELLDPQGLDHNVALIKGIDGMIVRLMAEDLAQAEERRCGLALYFDPATMAPEIGDKLNTIVNWLMNRDPELIGE